MFKRRDRAAGPDQLLLPPGAADRAPACPSSKALTDLRDSVENPRFREVISGLIESIQGGKNLSQALADYPDVFSTVFASLIRAGEETGRCRRC